MKSHQFHVSIAAPKGAERHSPEVMTAMIAAWLKIRLPHLFKGQAAVVVTPDLPEGR